MHELIFIEFAENLDARISAAAGEGRDMLAVFPKARQSLFRCCTVCIDRHRQSLF